MRTYPHNSPEAAARIVALATIADAHHSHSEDTTLETLDVERELGLSPGGFQQVMQALCEDRYLDTRAAVKVLMHGDEAMLSVLMAEIDDPALQRKVLRLCMLVTLADSHLADGEVTVLRVALRRWYQTPGSLVT